MSIVWSRSYCDDSGKDVATGIVVRVVVIFCENETLQQYNFNPQFSLIFKVLSIAV
jgi:hypothetical protein